MTTKEFEELIKDMDSNFHVEDSPQAPDVCGVYYNDCYILAIPSGNIYPETRTDYVDAFGNPHKNMEVAIAQLKSWLMRKDEELELDKEFKEVQAKPYKYTEKTFGK